MAKKRVKKEAKKPKTNKILKCPYRKQVDKQLLEKVAYRKISEWLAGQNPPFKASYNVISDYKKWFFNLEEKEQDLLDNESDQRLTTGVVNKLEKLKDLKNFADWAFSLGIKTEFFIDDTSGFTELDVEKFKLQVMKAAIQAQKEINKAMEHLETNRQPINFGDLDLLKDPEWIQSKKEAMDIYAAKIQRRKLFEFNRD